MSWNWSRKTLAIALTLVTLVTWGRHAGRPVLRADPAPAPLASLPRPSVLEKRVPPAPPAVPAPAIPEARLSPLRDRGEAFGGTAPL
jgi:hypothetical protein